MDHKQNVEQFKGQPRLLKENVSELFYSSDEKNQDEYSEISWVKVHVEQSGVHRVESGDERAARLRKTIENNYFQQQINTV
ncbi:hypothetical protein QQP08_018888 [Theobroma cacao]|nr:hypothetical protein QQP08_018888 [Theobroma cacao]